MTEKAGDSSPKATTPDGLVAIDSDTLLEFNGPDALTFLQGQTTADFAKAGVMAMRLGCFCDVKGRVLADFLALIVTPERVLMRVSADLAEPLLAHLKKYLMFSKTALSRSDLGVFGATGIAAMQIIELSNAPLAEGSLAEQAIAEGALAGPDAVGELAGGFALLRDRHRVECFLTAEGAATLADSNSNLDNTPTAEGWRARTILAGEARVRFKTWGKYLPQDLNYDLNHWVNFKKGCYTGQEVIARLHWRGTPKRRVYPAQVALAPTAAEALTAPNPGTALHSAGKPQSLGSIVNTARLGDALVMLVETTEDGLQQALTYEGCATPLSPITAP